MKYIIGFTKVLIALSFILLIYSGLVWIVASQVLYKDIDNLANDAIELTISDSHWSDHISQIDPDSFLDNFEFLVMTKYNLDSNLRATEPGLVEKELVFSAIDIEPGEYTYDPDSEQLRIIQEPSVHIVGYTEKKVEVLFYSGYVPIRFDVTVNNIRVD